MDDSNSKNRMLAVEGSHLTLPLRLGSKSHSILIPKTTDGRVLFMIPWQNGQVLGTTEKKYDEPIIDPKVDFENHLWMIKEISHYFNQIDAVEISKSVKSKWAGLRPLVLDESAFRLDGSVDTKKVSRNHVVESRKSGLISLMGGKWTSYREMAEEAVDESIRYLQSSNQQDKQYSKCGTKKLKLVGSFHKDNNFPFNSRKQYLKIYSDLLIKKYDLNEKTAKHLIKNYGERAFDVMLLTQQNSELKNPISENQLFIKAEILYAIRQEMAQNPKDVLLRRLRLGFVDQKAMITSLRYVIDIFAQEKQWTQEQSQQQYAKYFKELVDLDF